MFLKFLGKYLRKSNIFKVETLALNFTKVTFCQKHLTRIFQKIFAAPVLGKKLKRVTTNIHYINLIPFSLLLICNKFSILYLVLF